MVFKTKVAKPQEESGRKYKVNPLRKGLSRLDQWSKKEFRNETIKEQLKNRYMVVE